MNKKKILITLLCFVFVFLAIISLSSCVSSTPEVTSTTTNETERLLSTARTIKVVQIDGSATVTDTEGEIACFKGMNLYDGDKLDVKANSTLVVKFDDDKYVYLGENTTINLKSKGEDKFKTNIFVEKGKVLAEIQNQLGEDEEFFLSSNNSVMAVRGTVFGITVAKIRQEIIQKYSVYRGVTELYLFDTSKTGNLIKGKISDIQNSSFEVVVPEDEILDDNKDYNQSVDNWLSDVKNGFDDSEDANKELEEVQITVGTPSKEDYQEIIETISTGGGSTVTYSNIDYKATGYYGEYDGMPHSIDVEVEEKNAKVQYKTSADGEYSDTKPTFTTPGYYRTYYKITCDGYTDKEDYAVVQIAKGNLEINYKENLIVPGLIQGMPLENALENTNLADYIEVKGAAADSANLAKTTYSYSGTLENGTSNYEVTVNLDDSIKEYYKPITAEISLTAYELILNSTNRIYNGFLYIDNVYSFNKYNGILASELFEDASFTAGDQELYYDDVAFNFDYLTEGYYEISNGKNTVEVTLDFTSFSITTEVYFMVTDTRPIVTYDIEVDEVTVSTLGEGSYYFNTNDINVVNGKYQMTTLYFADHFGIGYFEGYINLPTDIVDNDSYNYLVSNENIIEFPVDSTSEVELLIFPTSSSKGSRKIISVYFSTTPPDNFPTYTIKSSLSYYPGSNFDFVISESPVEYSLDGKTFTSALSIDELGEYDVYFKVGSDVISKGTRTVLITTGGIESDGLSMISDTIEILSTDGITTSYKYYYDPIEYQYEDKEVVSEDLTAISPMNDIYEIYTNIIKNANYYNDLTHEKVEVEVSIKPSETSYPDFDYEVMSDGYASLKGSVHFEYKYKSTESQGVKPEPGMVTESRITMALSVVNPSDITISLSDVERVYASRIAYSLEDLDYDFEILYSIDEGATWTDETPVFTEAGVYKVYSIYKLDYTDSEMQISEDTLIIAIQNITVTE